MTKHEALAKYFGYSQFRPAQETIIDTILSGRDTLAVMPTGAGKSICFQIPALMMKGLTLVISPLISLMKDQVAALREGAIPAAYINSSLTPAQYREVLRRAKDGIYKLIYVAPERLETADFRRFTENFDISFIAIDEAHCVSQWGRDFRPGYMKIADFTNSLRVRPVTGAFTATATAQVQRDIIKLLNLKKPMCLTTGFDRPNLYFGVEKPVNKSRRFLELISNCNQECAVVYCSTRRTVDSVYTLLRSHGISATRYHAGLDNIERAVNQDSFLCGSKSVMVATNAFGMGIDKENVRYVIHYNMPKNLESYYQEAGRAGRDGKASKCILLYSEKDIKTIEHLIEHSFDNNELDRKEKMRSYRYDEKRLDSMVRYCEINSCLRSYILHYFGEKQNGKCNNCSNCLKPGLLRRLMKR